MGGMDGKCWSQVGERAIVSVERIQCAFLVTWKKNIGDSPKQNLRGSGLGGETRSGVHKPVGAIPREVVADG